MTSIEWVKNPDGRQGYTWNPITGCLNHDNGLCKGGGFPCYAYKLAHGRLKQRYLDNEDFACLTEETGFAYAGKRGDDPFYPRFWEERLSDPVWLPSSHRLPAPKGIFVCDMSDLFGIGIPEKWTHRVLNIIRHTPYNIYYLLTKQAQRLPDFSPFPDNCWVGVTATSRAALKTALLALAGVRARVKYISFEPLLSPAFCHHHWHTKPTRIGRRDTITSTCGVCGDSHSSIAVSEDFNRGHTKPIINWLIIGACTGTAPDMGALIGDYEDLTLMHWHEKTWTAQPKMEWVRKIVEAADKAGVPVFLKDNLDPLGLPLNSLYYSQYETEQGPEYRLRQEMPNGA